MGWQFLWVSGALLGSDADFEVRPAGLLTFRTSLAVSQALLQEQLAILLRRRGWRLSPDTGIEFCLAFLGAV